MPDFSLTDIGGAKRSLSHDRGRPIALFFFCGCPWCIKCAQQWGQFQRGATLAASLPAPSPLTVIVFSGNAAEAHSFARQTGLDQKQTVLLPDAAMQVTNKLYHAEPCPRVFVADPGGRLCYTNNHADDAPRQAPALVIISHTLQALRAASAMKSSHVADGKP